MTRRLTALGLVVGVLTLGCGASQGTRDYAAAVCGEIDAWVEAVNSSLRELSQGVKDRDSVAQEREAVVQHLDDVEIATEGSISRLRRVPTSGVEGADALTVRLVGLLEHTVSVTRSVRQDVRAIDDQGLQAFREAVGPLLGRRVGGAIRRVLSAPTDPAARDIADGFRDEPGCQDVLSPGQQETGPHA